MDYKITAVDLHNINEWQGNNGTVYYIPVMLEGHDKWVSVGKLKRDALKEGDTITGNIIPVADKPQDKWKAVSNFQGGIGGAQPSRPKTGGNGFKRDDGAIKAQWAIGQAVQLHIAVTAKGGEEAQSIYATAVELFHMVERVKNSDSPAQDEHTKNVIDALTQ